MASRLGQRVTLLDVVDRYPHARVQPGATGRIVRWEPDLVAVKLDQPVDGLEEWDNCLHWWEDAMEDLLNDLGFAYEV